VGEDSRGGEKRRGIGEGERERGKEVQRVLGEIIQGQIDKGVLYSTSGAICRYVHLWHLGSPPILHFLTLSQLAQIEIGLLFPPLTMHPYCPPLSLLFLSHLQSHRMPLHNRRTFLFLHILFPLLSLAFPFGFMNPSCVGLFPHVFLIIYTFSISRLLFSQLFRSPRRGFHIPPLIHLYARRCAGISPNASLIPYPFRA